MTFLNFPNTKNQNTMNKFLSRILLAIGACCFMTLASCDSDNDGPNPDNHRLFIDIVTYEAGNEQGSTFTFRRSGDQPVITLTTTQTLDKGFKVGSRVVIQYWSNSNERYVSGPITVLQVLHAAGDGEELPEKSAEQTSNWRSNTINMQSIERSGQYLNFIFTGSMGNRNINPSACVDITTVDNEYPVVHIIFGPDDSFSDKEYMFFGSYSLAALWNRPTCKGIMVYYKNLDNSDAHVQFDKVGSSITPGN